MKTFFKVFIPVAFLASIIGIVYVYLADELNEDRYDDDFDFDDNFVENNNDFDKEDDDHSLGSEVAGDFKEMLDNSKPK